MAIENEKLESAEEPEKAGMTENTEKTEFSENAEETKKDQDPEAAEENEKNDASEDTEETESLRETNNAEAVEKNKRTERFAKLKRGALIVGRLLWSIHPFERSKKTSRDMLDSDGVSKSNGYSRLFIKLRTVGSCIVAALVIFSASALLFGRDTVTVDNIYYLAQDISAMNSIGEGDIEGFSYTRPMSRQDFALYKNGLSVAGDREIKLFTATGRVTATVGNEMSVPKILSSDRHLLIYDMGGKEFFVYNSFASLYSEKLDYDIVTAAMADNGRFAIVSGDKNYSSSVTVYDSDLSKISTYNKNDYIISVDFDSSGRYLSVLSIDSSEGDYLARLVVFDTQRSKIKSSCEFVGRLPYFCEYVDGNMPTVFFSDGAVSLDMNCKQKAEISYKYSELEYVSVSGDGYALMFAKDKVGRENTIFVYDKKGKCLLEKDINGEFSDMRYSDEYIFLASDTQVLRVDVGNGNVRYAETNSRDARILVSDSGKIMVCGENYANIIDTWK